MQQPPFIGMIRSAYTLERKNLIALTGDIHGLFWNGTQNDFVSLDQSIGYELKDNFNIISFDMANGASMDKETEDRVRTVEATVRNATLTKQKDSLAIDVLKSNAYNPLPTLTCLREITSAFETYRRMREHVEKKESLPEVKPLCVLVSYAGSLFPEGGGSTLSELDRQRLVFFLNWVGTPQFANSPDMVILLNPTKSEINSKITSLPNARHIEIQLPALDERHAFVQLFLEKRQALDFEGGLNRFIEATAGLTIPAIQELLEVAERTDKRVLKQSIINKVDQLLKASLGDIINIKYPTHTPDDVIGYTAVKEILLNTFERCESPETAVSAIIVSGPNGGGKTFQLEAYATQSGRVVIELGKLRGKYFGDTDSFFELFRWYLATFGKILILVDEAHTAFGSVHSVDTHETEKRLAGNIIKMMSDRSLRGKVLWGLMTSRPDELDPDVKSRAPIQIPIFDLEGDERKLFVAELFRRKKIEMSEEEMAAVLSKTEHYSARDYDNFLTETLSVRKKKPNTRPVDVLELWQASRSIVEQRKLQKLIAVQHCSYPKLLPKEFSTVSDAEIARQVKELKSQLWL